VSMDAVFFSDFVLDRRTRQLRRGSDVLPIGARAFDVLEVLVTHSDRIVAREEVFEAVWPDTVVGENNLNVQVAKLRQVLGFGAIVTVPRRGLRFALDLEPKTEPLALPDRPSVVVLPFSNLGGEPALAWMADGFVEDITTELSRFRDLFVVARNSAFAFRDMPRDLRRIARDLGGPLRCRGERARNATTGPRDDPTHRCEQWWSNLGGKLQPHP